MASKEKLTVEKFEEITRRQILVRAAFWERLPGESGKVSRISFPNGQLHAQMRMFSFHRDEDGNESLLDVAYFYEEPNRSYDVADGVSVTDMWECNEVIGRERIRLLLQTWEGIEPWRVSPKPVVAIRGWGGKSYEEISPSEPHLLQQYARLHTRIAAILARTIKEPHNHQYFLCNVYYRLGAFIEEQNRFLEQALGLAVRTPRA
ncbi:MAG: hypothetical protein AAB652_01240 [Patescibacteria group bacterium]